MGWFSWLRGQSKTATQDAPKQRIWQSSRRYMVGDTSILSRDLTEANRIDYDQMMARLREEIGQRKYTIAYYIAFGQRQ